MIVAIIFNFYHLKEFNQQLNKERMPSIERQTIIWETRTYNHRKLIYNNGKIVWAMARDGL
jgi:hypothetical protein